MRTGVPGPSVWRCLAVALRVISAVALPAIALLAGASPVWIPDSGLATAPFPKTSAGSESRLVCAPWEWAHCNSPVLCHVRLFRNWQAPSRHKDTNGPTKKGTRPRKPKVPGAKRYIIQESWVPLLFLSARKQRWRRTKAGFLSFFQERRNTRGWWEGSNGFVQVCHGGLELSCGLLFPAYNIHLPHEGCTL